MTRNTTLSTLLDKYQSHLDGSAAHAVHQGNQYTKNSYLPSTKHDGNFPARPA
ncbi:hypothetical protein [Pectobacterium aroidearum]|uniref:hypothetical protein n=1 Tax=Pectobacterium aroidearum TaxID=1201031 RepID=UPI003003E734